MNKNMRHNQIIFLCSFLLVLAGCHNNAHLRTQKVLKPGENVYSGSGVLPMGGADENWNNISNTGVMGFRGEVSMLKGGKYSEAGPYFGVGIVDDGMGLILGYDYREYTGQRSGSPKKLGAQFEVNISEAGETFHLRPSLTSTTRREKPFYGGVHGLLAVGNLMDGLKWQTYDSSGYYQESYEEWNDYRFNSLGAGITAGAEFLTFNNNSIQLQVDVSLVKNSFSTDAELPDIDMENVTWASWTYENENIDEEWGSHNDELIPMVTGSIGMSFFKPAPTNKESFEPFPTPSYNKGQTQKLPVFDPETGEKISGGIRFNPETGEAIIEKQFDPETGTRGTALSMLEIRSLALRNAGQKHNGPAWVLFGLAGCGSGIMGGMIGGVMADFPGFVIGGTIGLGLPSLIASAAVPVTYYHDEIKTQNGKQRYKDTYVKETSLLRRRSTVMGTGVGLLGFGAFMLVLISSF